MSAELWVPMSSGNWIQIVISDVLVQCADIFTQLMLIICTQLMLAIRTQLMLSIRIVPVFSWVVRLHQRQDASVRVRITLVYVHFS